MTNKKIRFLSEKNIHSLITMREAINLMKDAFRQISEHRAVFPLRTGIDIPDHNANALFMPVYSSESNLIGMKLVTLFNNNPLKDLPLIHALVVLMDGQTGEPLAVMDGEYITALRTGAASGLATEYLARVDAEVAGIFGAGIQGHTQIEAICTVRKIKHVHIFDTNPEHAKKFADYIQKKFNIPAEIEADNSAAGNCDIICTATSSTKPVFEDAAIKDGTHINAIGTYQPDKRELPEETVIRAKVVVDQRQACLKEAGDLLIPLKKGKMRASHIYAELGELVNNSKEGRSNPSEISIFKSVGNAVQDVVVAGAIYKKAVDTGTGTEIHF
jgi:alanine dehydrogenase